MPAVNLKDHGDAQLEAGLLRTQEEEKIPFISPGLDQTRTGLAPCQLETSPDSGKMSSRKRLVMILMLSVVIGFALALAKDPSLPSSCLGWARGNDHFHTKTARSFLGKRADASVTNATTPGQTSEQGGSGARSEQSTTNPPVTTTSPKGKHCPFHIYEAQGLSLTYEQSQMRPRQAPLLRQLLVTLQHQPLLVFRKRRPALHHRQLIQHLQPLQHQARLPQAPRPPPALRNPLPLVRRRRDTRLSPNLLPPVFL